MPGQTTSFHELLTRIAAGLHVIDAPEDVDTTQQLISFGFATASFTQASGKLTYVQVEITSAGRSYLADWDTPAGQAVR